MMMTVGLETQLLELSGMFLFLYYPPLTLTIFLQVDYMYGMGMGTGGLQGAAMKEGQHDNRVRDAERPPLFDK